MNNHWIGGCCLTGIVFLVFLPLARPAIPGQEKFQKLEHYQSRISVSDVQSDNFFDEDFYDGFSEEDFEEESDILNLTQLKNLGRFARTNLLRVFVAPRIVKEFKADFVKRHKMIAVMDMFPSVSHDRQFIFTLDGKGDHVCRIGRYETESVDRTCDLPDKEMQCFNELILREELTVDDPRLALGIFDLFLTLEGYGQFEVVSDEEKFNRRLNEETRDEKSIEEIEGMISWPFYSYSSVDGSYRIKFFAFIFFDHKLFLDHWDVRVGKKGEIRPESHEYFVKQL